MSQNANLRISIEPEPGEKEKAVIAAAVLASLPKVQEGEQARPLNPWREAGKREALRGEM